MARRKVNTETGTAAGPSNCRPESKQKSRNTNCENYENIPYSVNHIWGGGSESAPHDFFDRSILKDRKSGGHGVSKSKLLFWEDT